MISNDFEVIARGSFLDTGTEPGKVWKLETITLRLNEIALDEWKRINLDNDPSCFATKSEWYIHLAENEKDRKAFTSRIKQALHLPDCDDCDVTLTQVRAEIFTLICIRELRLNIVESPPEELPDVLKKQVEQLGQIQESASKRIEALKNTLLF